MASVCNVNDAAQSTQLLAATTLRTVLGTQDLSEVLTEREHTATVILEYLDHATDPWGIKVRIEMGRTRKNIPNNPSCIQFIRENYNRRYIGDVIRQDPDCRAILDDLSPQVLKTKSRKLCNSHRLDKIRITARFLTT